MNTNRSLYWQTPRVVPGSGITSGDIRKCRPNWRRISDGGVETPVTIVIVYLRGERARRPFPENMAAGEQRPQCQDMSVLSLCQSAKGESIWVYCSRRVPPAPLVEKASLETPIVCMVWYVGAGGCY